MDEFGNAGNDGNPVYNGIELEGTGKRVSMAHSAFFERSEGTDHLESVLARDKSTLSLEQFDALSALSSVANMNYQICNGGLEQYFFNGYDQERPPFNDQDVKRVDKDAQVDMLRTLLGFGREVYPERREDNERLAGVVQAFDRAYYDIDTVEDFDEGCVMHDTVVRARAEFDERYYEVSDYLETLMEAYAQYLDKAFEKEPSLGDLAQEAKGRAQAKNADRPEAPKGRKPPEMGC